MSEGDADKLAVLVQCETEWHAESIAGALRGRGIAAQAEGGLVAGWRAEAPAKSRVMVFTRDLLAARLLLSELKSDGASIDWDSVDVGEPEGVTAGLPTLAGRIGGGPSEQEIELGRAERAGRNRAVIATLLLAVTGLGLLLTAKACGGP